MNSVEAEFQSRGVVRGNALYLAPQEGLRFIGRCRESGIKVLGIDGFLLTDEGVQPLLDHILDCSSASPEESWEAAEQFLRDRLDSSLMFEVTC